MDNLLVSYNDSDESDVEENIESYKNELESRASTILKESIENHEISINENGEITIELNKHNNNNNNNNNNKVNEINNVNSKKRNIDSLYKEDSETTTTTTTTTTNNEENNTKIGKIGDICNVCTIEKSKYKCPGCSILFCSLICSNKHKIDTKCTGVRKDNHFIPLNKFKDSDIVNDFNFLDKINRVNENGKAIVANSFIKFKSKHLQQFAFRKNINLYIMPKEMSRHKENTTSFKKPKNLLLWRVEWLFLDDDFKWSDPSIQDSMIMNDLLQKHIDDPVNIYNLKNNLKKLNSNRDYKNPNENFTVLMKRERDSKNQYYRFDLTKTFDENFQFKEIIEFPTLLVFTNNSKNLLNYNIISLEDQSVIEKQQLEIIKANLSFKTKYDPNLTNTEDQSKRFKPNNNNNNNKNGNKKNDRFKNKNNNNNDNNNNDDNNNDSNNNNKDNE
ncbi:hypothetical protein ACTFIR_006552 [Dictyostelium discoideum]